MVIYSTFYNLFVYSLAAFIFSFILVFISFCIDNILFFNIKRDFEKSSPYECGFQPFSDARGTVDIKFYLIAILFIIFDLEVIFIIPWAVNLMYFNLSYFNIMLIFLILLTLGFIYEWVKGALDA